MSSEPTLKTKKPKEWARAAEKLRDRGFPEASVTAFLQTGKYSAALAYLCHKPEEVYGTNVFKEISGRVMTPQGKGTLIDVKGGMARVLLDADDARARAEKARTHPRAKLQQFEGLTRELRAREVWPV
jgi:hypothetical protein